MDNYLSHFAPSLANTSYLEYTDSKAYFYDPNSSYEKIDNEERPIYEIIPSKNKNSIVSGDTPLEVLISNDNSIEQVPINKHFVKCSQKNS